MITTIFIATLLLYVWLSFFAYRDVMTYQRGKLKHARAALSSPPARWLLGITLCCHALMIIQLSVMPNETSMIHQFDGSGQLSNLAELTLAQSSYESSGLRFGFATALSVMVWLAIFIYAFETHSRPDLGWAIFIFPIAAITFGWIALFPGQRLTTSSNPLFQIHFVSAIIAHSFVFIVMFEAIAVYLISRQLHQRSIITQLNDHDSNFVSRWLDVQPPLWSLESMLYRHIWWALIGLSIAIASGTLYLKMTHGLWFKLNHKFLFSVIAAVVLAGILWLRKRKGLSEQQSLALCVTAFICLLLAYIGSHFVLEVILKR